MGRILNTLERITNQSGLSAGISDVSDVELLVSTLPTDSKETLKRDLGLDNATTDSQLVSLIASDEFGGGEPFTPVIEPIDIEGMQPFTPRTDAGESDPEAGIIDFLDNPEMQDGYGKGQGQGQGQGQGEGEGDEEGSGSGGSTEDGDGEESEGQGGSEGRSEEEEQQEKVERELLEFGYQPLFMDIKKLLDSVKTEDDDGSFKYLTVENLDYVDVHKRLYLKSDSLKYEVTVYSNDSIKPQDFEYECLIDLDKFLEQFRVSMRYYGNVRLGEKEVDKAEERVSKSEAFDTFNILYQKMIKQLNKALIEEAEKCSKFIENIK